MIVSHDAWLAARTKHLAKEKEFTHLRDQLSRERRELPWEAVDKHYTFEGENGKTSLLDMFAGRGQLVIYHAMFNPDTAGPRTTWTADALSGGRVPQRYAALMNYLAACLAIRLADLTRST
jgi:predicted dithiol-disulfide oxidoreductase (DUF899 family)